VFFGCAVQKYHSDLAEKSEVGADTRPPIDNMALYYLQPVKAISPASGRTRCRGWPNTKVFLMARRTNKPDDVKTSDRRQGPKPSDALGCNPPICW
jgi:hypothetical protein